jgi:hypothetical protein
MVIVNASVQSDESGKGIAHLDGKIEMESVTNIRTKEISNTGRPR